MPLYRLKRHVLYRPDCQQTEEVWGIDRPATGLHTAPAPRYTDQDDPLACSGNSSVGGACCAHLLKTECGRWVPWGSIWEWLSEAEAAGYEVVSGFEKLSPYSVIVLRGP
jgi:hypothetical protein